MPRSIARDSVISAGASARRPIVTGLGLALAQQPFTFPVGTYTFTPPVAGYWKFVGWGAGGMTSFGDSGASGAYAEITKYLTTVSKVTIVVGAGSPNGSGNTTTITFPDGSVVTIPGGGVGVAGGGTPTGGDVNLPGTNGVVNSSGNTPPAAAGTGGGPNGGSNGGAGAPANLPYRGGAGSASGSLSTHAPGGGGSSGQNNIAGGDGAVIAAFVRA